MNNFAGKVAVITGGTQGWCFYRSSAGRKWCQRHHHLWSKPKKDVSSPTRLWSRTAAR